MPGNSDGSQRIRIAQNEDYTLRIRTSSILSCRINLWYS